MRDLQTFVESRPSRALALGAKYLIIQYESQLEEILQTIAAYFRETELAVVPDGQA